MTRFWSLDLEIGFGVQTVRLLSTKYHENISFSQNSAPEQNSNSKYLLNYQLYTYCIYALHSNNLSMENCLILKNYYNKL